MVIDLSVILIVFATIVTAPIYLCQPCLFGLVIWIQILLLPPIPGETRLSIALTGRGSLGILLITLNQNPILPTLLALGVVPQVDLSRKFRHLHPQHPLTLLEHLLACPPLLEQEVGPHLPALQWMDACGLRGRIWRTIPKKRKNSVFEGRIMRLRRGTGAAEIWR